MGTANGGPAAKPKMSLNGVLKGAAFAGAASGSSSSKSSVKIVSDDKPKLSNVSSVSGLQPFLE